jgi:very-short-patch-repair endonuclease
MSERYIQYMQNLVLEVAREIRRVVQEHIEVLQREGRILLNNLKADPVLQMKALHMVNDLIRKAKEGRDRNLQKIKFKAEDDINRIVRETREFIQKAITKHGKRYGYHEVIYRGSQIDVLIYCGVHGFYPQRPNNHLCGNKGKGSICERCSKGDRRETTLLTRFENFLTKAIQIHGDRYDYSLVLYVKNSVYVVIICKEHGEFLQIPASHTSGRGCPTCGKFAQQSANRRAFELCRSSYVGLCESLYGHLYEYSQTEYRGSNVHVRIFCKTCQRFFNQIAKDHYGGKGCYDCGRLRILGYLKDYSRRCGELFPSRAQKVHGDLYSYVLVVYKGSDNKVKIVCNTCRNVFEQTPHNHLSGHGCNICVHKTQRLVFEFLNANFTVRSEVTFPFTKRARFDFCIGKTLIELDGPQHFRQIYVWKSPEKQFAADFTKTVLANREGYRVIRLLQEDVFCNRYNWRSTLLEALLDSSTEDANVFLYLNDEYDKFIQKLNEHIEGLHHEF